MTASSRLARRLLSFIFHLLRSVCIFSSHNILLLLFVLYVSIVRSFIPALAEFIFYFYFSFFIAFTSIVAVDLRLDGLCLKHSKTVGSYHDKHVLSDNILSYQNSEIDRLGAESPSQESGLREIRVGFCKAGLRAVVVVVDGT